ncbi:hypothetical protein [Alkalihalobacillus sp. BA299]|uniref:hypothetical protein n=1 Tax=Alkalihalobacillus sp. BA299 TaxID=2815938 RepID=UPI001ADCFDD5|nr:hypothetical protein [Alkalihalobacillus sp. BA299]
MLYGTWLVNLYLGIVAFFIVFLGSLGNNLIKTTCYRAAVAFVVTFLITYFFRWLWSIAFASSTNKVQEDEVLFKQELNKIEDPTEDREYSDEDIQKASEYVRELLDDKEV